METLFSIFVIPTLAGYIFLTKTNYHKVKVHGISNTLLFIECFLYGFFLLYISYIFLSVSVGDGLPKILNYILGIYYTEQAFSFTNFLRQLWAIIKWPFDVEVKLERNHFSQEAFFALIIAFLYSRFFELNIIKDSSWYNNKVMASRDKTRSELEKMLYFAMNTVTPVQISLKNRKVYVGFLNQRYSQKPDGGYIQLLPLKSSYRNEKTLEVSSNMTDYSFMMDLYLKHKENEDKGTLIKLVNGNAVEEVSPLTLESSLSYGIFINLSEILSIGLWDGAIFNKFKYMQAESNKKSK